MKRFGMDMEKFLQPTPYIDCDAEPVKEKSRALVQGIPASRDKAIRIFYAVRDGIKYTIYGKRSLPEHFRASVILSAGEGYCVQKAILLVALARAASIPARLRLAAIRSHLVPKELLKKRGTDLFPYHGYADLHVDGVWVKATPTFDIGSCTEGGLRRLISTGSTMRSCLRRRLMAELTSSMSKTGAFSKTSPLTLS